MPYLSAPACVLNDCGAPDFPVTAASCICTTAKGGVNELYFLPCTEIMSEGNVIDTDWWTNLVGSSPGGSILGRSGIGKGSISKKSTRSIRVGSCRTEQVVNIVWSLKYVMVCFDKTSARSTCSKLTELINNFDKYILIARMCDGDDVVLPIGVFTTSDFDWIVPDNFEEEQSVSFEVSWNELALPCTVDVPGLSAVLPKLS